MTEERRAKVRAILARDQQHKLQCLQRREEFLRQRMAQSEHTVKFLQREADAIAWARDIIEAAALLGKLDELQAVAGMPNVDPEAWARRGTVVGP